MSGALNLAARISAPQQPISALQSEYLLLSRDVEAEILPVVNELQMTFIPFSPLGRGMFTDNFDVTHFQPNDSRLLLPRFQGEHLHNNQQLTLALRQLAQRQNITVAQLALAWILAKAKNIIPIPGTKKRHYIGTKCPCCRCDTDSSGHCRY